MSATAATRRSMSAIEVESLALARMAPGMWRWSPWRTASQWRAIWSGPRPSRWPRSGEVDVAVAGLPEEVLLEGELHEVGLGSGDEHAVLAGWEHLVGEDEHP